MDNKPIFFQECEFKNEIDLVDKALNIFSVIKKNDNLRPFERNILNYYIRKDISDETKEIIKKELDINSANLTQGNYYLRKKGYIVKDTKNHNNNKLCKELQMLRDSLIINKKRLYCVGFKMK